MKCIKKGLVPKPETVALNLEPQYKHWVKHKIFTEGLPLRLADFEAQGLLQHYWNKRLIKVVASSYEHMMRKPECARDIVASLKVTLEEVV